MASHASHEIFADQSGTEIAAGAACQWQALSTDRSGWLLIPALVALAVKCIPHDVWERCRKESEGNFIEFMQEVCAYVQQILY
ncbi:MAG: hypothetical protein LIO94_02810 [Clostridiales bacterium]|nr:hypothetical protein [Clostridiales bacterium]